MASSPTSQVQAAHVDHLQGIGGDPTGGGKGWVRGKEARSGSACSRRFSAGSRGEFMMISEVPGSSEALPAVCERVAVVAVIQAAWFVWLCRRVQD